jgi:hypothetical protein
MRQYQELRRLTPAGIRSRNLPEASGVLADLVGAACEPSSSVDRALLLACQAVANPLPLLCLRCRISHALEAWFIAAYRAHREQHGIELEAMASYGLDDDGALTIRTGPSSRVPFAYADLASLPAGVLSPFSAEVLRSYEPARSGLPHWARLKIQGHTDLKAYFREHGLLLISDWALLRDSSRRRVRQACQEQLRSSETIDALCALHQRYCPLYDAAKATYRASRGKAAGWQPDLALLLELAPDQQPQVTVEQLRAIAHAVRLLLTSTTRPGARAAAELVAQQPDPRSFVDVCDADEDDESSPAALRALIDAALQRAMDQHMPLALASAGAANALLYCLWAGWAEGLTNRPLADRCGTSCGTVSKKLRPMEHATAIATAAAVELKRHQAFASCGQSVEAAERLVDALRNHLLEPEQEEGVAPMRQWVRCYLSKP